MYIPLTRDLLFVGNVMTAPVVKYAPSLTMSEFHHCDDFVRCVMGPFGSGKTTGAVMELLMRCVAQRFTSDGKRRSKWGVVRNSYRELKDTTLQTFFEWVPRTLGEWREGDFAFNMSFNDVEAQVVFRALDRPDDIRKLLSAEYTGIFFNELRHIAKPIFDTAGGRVGRYPKRGDFVEGVGWHGMIGDTNPPDEDSWLYRVFEEERPVGYRMFRQPGGRDPNAENLENLPPRYYERMAVGKDPEWVKVYVDGEYGFVIDGRAVHPLFKHHIHVSEVEEVEGLPVVFGCDFGLTPAAVFGQHTPSGQVRIYRELVTEDMGAERFGGLCSEMLGGEFQRFRCEGWGDPAGDQRSQVRDEETVLRILQGQGIPIMAAPSNDPVLRQESLNHLLGKLDMRGEPAIQIHPRCRMLVKGLSGGYRYRRLQVSGMDRFTDKPDKNIYSHVCEALHYLLLGQGLGYTVMEGRRGSRHRKPRVLGALRRVA